VAIEKWNTRHEANIWQPIETAPRDGTTILGWDKNGYKLQPYICWFGCDANANDEVAEKAWWTGSGDDFSDGSYYTLCKPTHWQMMPQIIKSFIPMERQLLEG
jgi:hypothetical protein